MSLQDLLLGMKEVSDFVFEAKLDAIRIEVKIASLDFLLLGWRFKILDEESAKESNEE